MKEHNVHYNADKTVKIVFGERPENTYWVILYKRIEGKKGSYKTKEVWQEILKEKYDLLTTTMRRYAGLVNQYK